MPSRSTLKECHVKRSIERHEMEVADKLKQLPYGFLLCHSFRINHRLCDASDLRDFLRKSFLTVAHERLKCLVLSCISIDAYRANLDDFVLFWIEARGLKIDYYESLRQVGNIWLLSREGV